MVVIKGDYHEKGLKTEETAETVTHKYDDGIGDVNWAEQPE